MRKFVYFVVMTLRQSHIIEGMIEDLFNLSTSLLELFGHKVEQSVLQKTNILHSKENKCSYWNQNAYKDQCFFIRVMRYCLTHHVTCWIS